MQYRSIGTSDLRVSEVSFGCMSLGTDMAVNKQLIDHALAKGITLFDTADLYDKGLNEQQLGQLLSGRRQEVVLATKAGNQWRADGSGWDWNPRKEYILAAVEESLRRLQTDYIDLYQLHGGTLEDNIDEAIEAFELLQQQGKIRYYGISSIRPNVIRAWVERSHMVSVMMQYSLLDRRPEESCMPLLQQHGISVLARGSVAKGLLAGKSADVYLDYTAAEVQRAADAVVQLSSNARTPAQTAVRYVLHNAVISSAVVGIRTMAQLQDALYTSETTPLKDTEITLLQQSLPANYYQQHR